MIAIIDYNAGNIASVRQAFEYVGAECCVTADAGTVRRASKIVLPGVGNYSAMKSLTNGIRTAIADAISGAVPFFGICLGMQWLFEGSDESPEAPGLALFSGYCERFPAAVKSPHVGWNQLQVDAASRLMAGVESGAYVYYTHSYRAPVVAHTVARTCYGTPFTAALENGNLFGVQFHPEKSGEVGLRIVRNFCEL